VSTSLTERQYFLRRLVVSPLFLARHARALTQAVCRRASTQLRLRLASPHQGLKERPPWLANVAVARTPGTARLELPRYTQAPLASHVVARAATAPTDAGSADPERILFAHRWSFLVERVVAGRAEASDLTTISEWIAAHRPSDDMTWETYSACERVANLLLYLAVQPESAVPDAIAASHAAFIAESLAWIAAHLEYYGDRHTNNHLLNNARALVMGGVAIGDEAALAIGLELFGEMLPQTILGGGFLRERSSHYQLIVLGWVLDAWHFAVSRRGVADGPVAMLESYARAMLPAASLVCDEQGNLLACIGDVSPDAAPCLTSARLATLYPEWWPRARPSHGNVELRDGWFRVDAGDGLVLGNLQPRKHPLPYPQHGHADQSSFVWRQGEIEILIDPGRYRYTDDAVSLRQRSAAAHNLPLVNGFAPVCETLLPNGAWWPQPYADAALELGELPNGVVLAHDGFARATPARRHERRIVLDTRALEVTDVIDGTGAVELTQCWNLGASFANFDAATLTATGSLGALRFRITGVDAPPVVKPASGNAPGGFISMQYGHVQPAVAIALSWNVVLPLRIKTRFELSPCVA
jgi:hypothetical protein